MTSSATTNCANTPATHGFSTRSAPNSTAWRGEIEAGTVVVSSVNIAVNENAPVAFVVPAEGVTAYDYHTGLASTATNTAAAHVFMNWNLSKRGQQVFSDMGEYSVRSDIAAPHVRGIQLPDFDDPRVHRITPAQAIVNAADYQKIWNAIFGYNESRRRYHCVWTARTNTRMIRVMQLRQFVGKPSFGTSHAG